MNIDTKTEKIVDAKTGLNDFITLTDKAQFLSLTNWRTVNEEVGEGANKKEFIKFKADVWKYGDSRDLLNVLVDKPKVFWTTHVDFRKKVNALLENKKSSEAVLIRAKVVDATKKPIIYDVELA